MKRTVRWASIILALILFGISAFFAWKIWKTESDYRAGIEAYEQLVDIAYADGGEGPGEIPVSSQPGEGEDSGNLPQTESDTESKESDIAADGYQETSDAEELTRLPDVNFRALQEVNPDIVGWIYSPDTEINYPVVQGTDNSYYLTHLADGSENRNGCPFLDVQNNREFNDDNSIIYGHHMQNGTMFAGITWYSDQTYFEEHPVLYLMTPETIFRIELFSGYTTTMDSSAYMQTFGSVREHTDWLKEVSRKSDFRANLEISALDRVLTLSTCAYGFDNARYVLHGKMVELKEAA